MGRLTRIELHKVCLPPLEMLYLFHLFSFLAKTPFVEGSLPKGDLNIRLVTFLPYTLADLLFESSYPLSH